MVRCRTFLPLTALRKKLFKKLRRSRRHGPPIVAMTNTSRVPDNSAAHNECLLKPSDGKACTQSDVEKTTKRVGTAVSENTVRCKDWWRENP